MRARLRSSAARRSLSLLNSSSSKSKSPCIVRSKSTFTPRAADHFGHSGEAQKSWQTGHFSTGARRMSPFHRSQCGLFHACVARATSQWFAPLVT